VRTIRERLRILCVQKGLSQGAIERRSGLHACFVSRVENGYSVPGLETLKRMVGVETPYESSYSRFVRSGSSEKAGSI
jgi:transcriptional regulator with XRE-family HTH domain